MTDVKTGTPRIDLNHAFPPPLRLDVVGAIQAFATRMMYSVAKDKYTSSNHDVFTGLAFSVRDRLMERWFQTQNAYYKADAKRVYYLSLEFLMGRSLLNNILNLGASDIFREAMSQLGYRLEAIEDNEVDAGLGNGGLGRLAACFLESAATLGIPFYGYGIRYEYGIFRQNIHEGFQVEAPDNWLRYGNPWEIPRTDALFPIQFYGRIQYYKDDAGIDRIDWVDSENVLAMAYDMPIIGYGDRTVNSLRLWAAKSTREFDLAQFNVGDYVRAVEDKNQSENISKVLYPADDKYSGKELRLKQQYFFVSATLQDLVRRFTKRKNRQWSELPDKVAIQLNDTHPAIAIPELMRVLVDKERLSWDLAWDLTRAVFAFTNHTVLPEALETWPWELLSKLLPRHVQIIEEIDRRHRLAVTQKFPNDATRLASMGIIDESGQRSVRMANLAIVGSHSVNGVAKLHTEILKASVFRDFHELFPGKFNNKTNGITPRRWLMKSNPGLTQLLREAIGDSWTRDLDQLHKLEAFADDGEFRRKWREVKRQNKIRLSEWAKAEHHLELDPETLFDVQVKRIHEYKRQLLNVLGVIDCYHRIKAGEQVPVRRTVLIGGKAAPSYVMAKLIIKLVHAVAAMVDNDPDVRGLLKVAFVPNYGVSAAERIFPACELSEQISTAGTEASGTGNMKASLNGALTIGTLDGANVEIREQVGDENIFIFGHHVEQVEQIKRDGYDPNNWISTSPRLQRVLQTLSAGILDEMHPGLFRPIAEGLIKSDRYLHCADFDSYVAMHEKVARTYQDHDSWTRMSILNVAGMGLFSSDRTIRQYATEIWDVKSIDPTQYTQFSPEPE